MGNCGRFGGEGTGSHCRIFYPFLEGRSYTVRIELSGATSTGELLTGYIIDTVTGERSTIGTLLLPTVTPYQGSHCRQRRRHPRQRRRHSRFGRLVIKGAAFQEYFKATGCEGQAFSSVGLMGPYFSNRSVVASQAFANFANPECLRDDVSACIPGHGCGAPRVHL